MANLDFIVVPLNKYLDNHKKFGNALTKPPKVFATNYFLKNQEGKYSNGMLDKLVWVMWSEARFHGEFDAIETPMGFIPKYNDLKTLFKQYLDKEYSEEEYLEQFTMRIPKLLAKLDRIEANFKKEENMPQFFWDVLNMQRKDLNDLKEKSGKDLVAPLDL